MLELFTVFNMFCNILHRQFIHCLDLEVQLYLFSFFTL